LVSKTILWVGTIGYFTMFWSKDSVRKNIGIFIFLDFIYLIYSRVRHNANLTLKSGFFVWWLVGTCDHQHDVSIWLDYSTQLFNC
jgi:hypothetical protein